MAEIGTLRLKPRNLKKYFESGLAHGSKSVCSQGSNGYPGQSIDRGEPSEVFCQFRMALQQLIPDASKTRLD